MTVPCYQHHRFPYVPVEWQVVNGDDGRVIFENMIRGCPAGLYAIILHQSDEAGPLYVLKTKLMRRDSIRYRRFRDIRAAKARAIEWARRKQRQAVTGKR